MIKHAAFVGQRFLLFSILTIAGCNENERVAQVALDAAERQAEQNQQIAENSRQVAAGAKRLIEADSQSREELIDLQHNLQAEQSRIGGLRDDLENERREVAAQRLTESRLGPIVKSCVAAAVCLVTIGFCWYLLYGLRHDDADQTLSELLVEELASDKPSLLPRFSPPKTLSTDEAARQLPPE